MGRDDFHGAIGPDDFTDPADTFDAELHDHGIRRSDHSTPMASQNHWRNFVGHVLMIHHRHHSTLSDRTTIADALWDAIHDPRSTDSEPF